MSFPLNIVLAHTTKTSEFLEVWTSAGDQFIKDVLGDIFILLQFMYSTKFIYLFFYKQYYFSQYSTLKQSVAKLIILQFCYIFHEKRYNIYFIYLK